MRQSIFSHSIRVKLSEREMGLSFRIKYSPFMASFMLDSLFEHDNYKNACIIILWLLSKTFV